MSSLGDKLRQVRERRGVSIAQVAAQTRINPRYLEAIEADDWQSLPGGFFYKSFVQQYASMLGIDPGEVKLELHAEPAPADPSITAPAAATATLPPRIIVESLPPSQPLLGQAEPLTSRTSFRFLLLIVMIAACSGVYAMWDRAMHPADIVKVPVQASPPPPTVAATPAPPPAAAPDVVPTNSPPPPSETAPPTPASAVPPPLIDPEKRGKLHVTATDSSWVSISAAGKSLYVGTMNAGESKSFDSLDTAKIVTGNAAGLRVHWQGQPVGELGPKGEVRIVQMTSEKATVEAPPPKPPKTDDAVIEQ